MNSLYPIWKLVLLHPTMIGFLCGDYGGFTLSLSDIVELRGLNNETHVNSDFACMIELLSIFSQSFQLNAALKKQVM